MAIDCRRCCQSSGSRASCQSRKTWGRRASYNGRQRSSSTVRTRHDAASARNAGPASTRAAPGGTLILTASPLEQLVDQRHDPRGGARRSQTLADQRQTRALRHGARILGIE